MNFSESFYVVTNDLKFAGVLHDIKKSQRALQPIFEAFTNSIEAIKIRAKEDLKYDGKINITIKIKSNLGNYSEFESITIKDNGIGFNDIEFKRFNTYKDFTKGYKNLGSGRIQYAHYFDSSEVKSIFKEGESLFERNFIISKNKTFLDNNAIVFHKNKIVSQSNESGTEITFKDILEKSNIYNSLTDKTLKEALLERYVHYFCYNANSLPAIKIKCYLDGSLTGESEIVKSDIPIIDKTDYLKLQFSKVADNGKGFQKIDKFEDFTIDAFKIRKEILKSNDLKLTSKGEIIEESNVSLESLAENDNVKGFKYLFLISSNYIDNRDTNIRGILNIPTSETFGKGDIFETEEILLEDIQQGVNEKIDTMYPEIEEVKQNHDLQLEKLKEMFLLDDETAKDLNISINDNESKILEKFYEAEAKKTANIDAKIKESIDKLEDLDTTADDYPEKLESEIKKLVKVIPLQNKTSLTHYVARRKLVLDLFDKILAKKLAIQSTKKGTSFSESLIHNLLFQQQSTDSENSDLWILNEDFIYFKGSSEKQLSKVEINGELLFKEIFTVEEEKYLTSLGENRKIKRPDVLLFPEEGKCLILEFKSTEVNVSEHLTQIDMYASLIRNYTQDKFQITTFYGYLLGEAIEPKDVLGRVSSYEHSYQFDYLFRPSQKVVGFERSHGSIYSEVLKYSTLLERAKKRNEIFIDKIHNKNNQ
ncbi:hypothetical protein [Flavobacterium marginilacus]|uniref:hypothetical protein n=1 Tax=Flavobacterium marginilacus TaxID=3003256 RepID=UPI00248F33A5|nr:hypothetical protein [Flavobacterium marginilacus]